MGKGKERVVQPRDRCTIKTKSTDTKVCTQKCAHSQDKKSGQKSVSTININLKYNKISKKLILHLKFNLKSIKNSLETDSLQCAITGSLKLPHTLVYHLRLKTIPQFCWIRKERSLELYCITSCFTNWVLMLLVGKSGLPWRNIWIRNKVMQWVVVIKIYFVEKAKGGYISTMIQIIITISRKQKASTSNNLTQHI